MNGTSSKNNVIASFLEDLTHLQIDTILKSGMTAVDPPEKVDELLRSLYLKYTQRLKLFIHRHEQINFSYNQKECESFADLDLKLQELQTYMDDKELRLEKQDYVVFLRMLSFCRFIKGKGKQYTILDQSATSVYTINLCEDNEFSIEQQVTTRDLSKLKRFHDLGTERIVMQTRIGLDGDVVSRIDEDFANNPRQLLVDIHDKHTKLSMDYWNNLISTAIKIVGNIFDFKK